MTFFPSYCAIKDLRTWIRIGTGHEKEGIIWMRELLLQALLLALLIVFYSGTSALIILPFSPHLKLPIAFSISKLECEPYELEKHLRASYLSRINNHNVISFALVILMYRVLVIFLLSRVFGTLLLVGWFLSYDMTLSFRITIWSPLLNSFIKK